MFQLYVCKISHVLTQSQTRFEICQMFQIKYTSHFIASITIKALPLNS